MITVQFGIHSIKMPYDKFRKVSYAGNLLDLPKCQTASYFNVTVNYFLSVKFQISLS